MGTRTRSSLNSRPGSWSSLVRTWPRKQRTRKISRERTNARTVSRFDNMKHPGHLNESVVEVEPVITLITSTPAFEKSVNSITSTFSPKTSLINAPWTYAVR
jgi:hypothetical protein